MSILSLLLVLAAADRDDSLAQKMLPIYVKEASEYSIAVESAPQRPLEFKKEPVFEWSNPVGQGGIHQGAIFLWLRDGRPAALGDIFSHPVPGWKGRKVLHEFLALDRDKLLIGRPGGALNEWKPQAGLDRKELPDAGTPAATRGARLVQMRRLAQQFNGHSTDNRERWELHLLPTPLYRYPEARSGVIDGALFALTSSAGTDPEVLLLIEARQQDGKTRWEYACGRFGIVSMYVQHKGTEVWSSVLNGTSDVWWHDRLYLYCIYPEKIVTPEGKLLARMRLTANEGEVVLPVGEK